MKEPSNRGVTLIELMIAVALIGVISLGVIGVFSGLSKGIQFSKNKTIAANLAQEQMQIIKQKSFNKVLITTAAAYVPGFGSDVPYDPYYYPPETILEGGVTYKRYTYVQVALENSGILTYPPSFADTGMKAITVSVTWNQGTETKKLQIMNILANIETTAATSVFSGRVTYATNSASGVAGALVTVAENTGWQDYADATGNYRINLNPGSYRMIVSAKGFFPQYVSASVAVNQTNSQNFSLVAMGSGTIQGTVWLNDHLVISQVVGSALNSVGTCAEFVEIFNPSTWTWTIASNATTPVVDLKIQKYSDTSPATVVMNYTNLTVAPNSYYIFANTTTVTMAGTSRTADAVYRNTNPGYPDLIPTSNNGGPCSSGTPDADAVGIAYSSSGDWIDRLGWTKDMFTHLPNLVEGTGILQVGTLQDGEAYVRRTSTSTTAPVVAGHGRAYDSGNNNSDFTSGIPGIYPPRNTSNTETVVAGTPAIGSIISANDGLSQSVSATNTNPSTSPAVAVFQLTSVATGTWTVVVTSGSAEMEISSVVVTANNKTYIPNSITSPVWPVTNYNSLMLSTTVTQGFISGWVRDAFGLAINSPSSGIPVSAAGGTTNANTTTGNYFLRLATGVYDVSANSGNVSSSYISQTSATVVVTLGAITSNVNFSLSQGGRIRGSVTRDGINAIPGVSVIAIDSNDVTREQEVSGSSGQFLLINLATGTYTVEPVLGSGESSSPGSYSVTVTAGATVVAGTFTITGVFGTIRGSVTSGGSPIRTGVLLICSTSTISGAPPALSSGTLTGSGYYLTNSYEDGTYSVDVIGSTTTNYKVYAYYTTFNGTTSSTSLRSNVSVSVTPGNTTSSVNFSW